jgi:hypothetical protein
MSCSLSWKHVRTPANAAAGRTVTTANQTGDTSPEETNGVRADTHRINNSQRTLEAQGLFNRRLSRETWGAPGRTSSSWPTASFTRNRRIQN